MDILSYLKQPEWWMSVKDIQDYISNGCIRRVIPTSDRLVFFVLLRFRNFDRRDDSSGDVLDVVSDLIESRTVPIENTAIYELDHADYLGVLKAEARDLFAIGKLVKSLNESLAPYNCVTMTCVVADPDIRGQEELDISALALHPSKQAARSWLPKLFAATSSPDSESVIEWAMNYVFDKKRPQEYLFAAQDFIDSVMCFVRDKDDSQLVVFMLAVYRGALAGVEPALNLLHQRGASSEAIAEVKSKPGSACFQGIASLTQALLPSYVSPDDWRHVDRLRESASPDAPTLGSHASEWLTLAEALFTFHESVWQLNRAFDALGQRPFGGTFFK